MSLRSKLVLSFVSITLVSVLVLSIINNVFTSKSLTTTAGEIAQTLADAQAREVSSIIESQVNLLSALTLDELLLSTLQTTNQTYTGTPETIRAEIQELDKVWIAADQAANTQEPLILDRLNNLAAGHLVEYNLRFPANVELIATDKYGAIAGAYTFSSNTNVRGHPSDYDQSDESWWQSAYNQGLGDIFIGEPEFDDSVGSLTIILAMPVRKPGTGEVLGVLRTTLSLNLLSQITKIYIGDTGLFDIYFPGETTHQLALGDYKTVDPTDLAVISSIGDEPFIIGQYKGNSSLISQSAVISAVKAITRLGWTVVYHQHEEEALRPITLQTKNNTVLAIIVAIVVGVMTSIIAQAISRPIMELTSSVQLVAKGDLTVRAAERGQDEIGVLSRAFNSMTEQLRNIINTLEQRVVERTRAIETSAEVSRRLSTILDQKQLVFAVVEEIQSSFEFYHTQIYLYDEAREFLIMVGGTGEAGQTMLMRGHKIARGRGLVGRAAESNTVVLVSDTSSDSNWLPNPLLPETRSEVAVPIAVGEQVLGVLDVQHTIVGRLEEQNVALLKSIANQIAIAVQNARLYSEAQEQAEKEELIFNISQKIQIATSIEHVLETAARELGQALGSPKVTIQLSNPAKIKGNGK